MKRLYATTSLDDSLRMCMRLKQNGIDYTVKVHTDTGNRIRRSLDFSGQYGLGFKVAPVIGTLKDDEPDCIYSILVHRKDYKKAKDLL